MRVILLVVMLLGSLGVSASDISSGNNLLEQCDEWEKVGGEGFHTGYCMGFINGVRSSVMLFKLNTTCIPEAVTLAQSIRVVHKYLNEHPERLHEHKIILTLDALKEAFPCKR